MKKKKNGILPKGEIMKEYIEIKDEYPFRECLTIFSYFYNNIINEFNVLAEKIERELIKYKVEEIVIKSNEKIKFFLKDLETNEIEPSLHLFMQNQKLCQYKYYNSNGNSHPCQVISESLISDIQDIMYKLENINIKMNGNITLTDGEFIFTARMNLETINIKVNNLSPGIFLQIYIRSKNKVDIFYYDLATRKLGQLNKNDCFLPLSPLMETKILDAFDTMKFSLLEFIENGLNDTIVSINKNGRVTKPSGYWKFLYEDTHYELEFKENNISCERDVEFLECITCEVEVEQYDNKESIDKSMKEILTNLKNNKIKLGYGSKIKIPNTLFFNSITPEKKEIDPFFNDPDILINCDLSKINFDNADIRGMDLSGTNIKLVLNKLYKKSIEGTKLKGIDLTGQTLDGITADNADLRDTKVIVYIENTSIRKTRFSDSSPFYLNFILLSEEVVKSMGIILEDSENKEVELLLARQK